MKFVVLFIWKALAVCRRFYQEIPVSVAVLYGTIFITKNKVIWFSSASNFPFIKYRLKCSVIFFWEVIRLFIQRNRSQKEFWKATFMGSKKLAKFYNFYRGKSWVKVLDLNFKGLEPQVSNVAGGGSQWVTGFRSQPSLKALGIVSHFNFKGFKFRIMDLSELKDHASHLKCRVWTLGFHPSTGLASQVSPEVPGFGSHFTYMLVLLCSVYDLIR